MRTDRLTLQAAGYRDKQYGRHVQVTAQCPCGRGGWLRLSEAAISLVLYRECAPSVSELDKLKTVGRSSQSRGYPEAHYDNIYVDTRGQLRYRKNPTPGLYYFDGQFFYRKKRGGNGKA